MYNCELKDLIIDKSIKSSLFKLPAGIKIETIDAAYSVGSRPKSYPSKKLKPNPKAIDKDKIPDEVKDMLKGLF